MADLLDGKDAWKRLPAWDGPARFFAQVASCGDAVYMSGGSDVAPAFAGQPVRQFLRDGHRYDPNNGWTKLPDMPRAAQAGVAACHDGRFLVFGGNDGTHPEDLREKHPGFRLDVLEYDPGARSWSVAGEVPASLVTTGIVRWRGEFVIPGGEDRPGHRSAKVVAATIVSKRRQQPK